MTKISWKSGTMISPLPAALISSGTVENPNVMTVSWTGIINSDPTITYVSIRPSRYSHEIISKTGEFVINLSTYALAEATDYCGVKSGRTENKFEKMNLTPAKCEKVSAPQVEESPVSIECRVIEVKKYGTHDMFIAEVLAVNVDDKYVEEDGRLALEKAGVISYIHGEYYTLGRKIGDFGFSVNKKRLAKAEKTKEEAKKEREAAKKESEAPKKREYVKREGGFRRERTEGTGERRSSERREGGYKRRESDGESRGRSFEKRDGGFRRERTEGTGERSSERREGGYKRRESDGQSSGGERTFQRREGGTGGRPFQRRDGESAGRSSERREGGFRRERTEGTGERRSSERREGGTGGRSFQRRDGESGGRSFEKRDNFKRSDSDKPRERREDSSNEKVQKKKYGNINKVKRESSREKSSK